MAEDMPNDPELIRLLLDIKEQRQLDFGQYRMGFLKRRIDSRLRCHKIDNYRAYLRFIKQHPEEMALLIKTMTINLTGFFRDKAAWQVIEQQIVPAIITQKINQRRHHIRVWSAGTSTGEEAYSIALLFNDALKKQPMPLSLKVFGTDIDESSLRLATKGVYSADKIKPISPHALNRYFKRQDNQYEVEPELRKLIQFKYHDLVDEPPLLSMDLIICRNVLIYFNRTLQMTILNKFHQSLRPESYLMLGKTETLLHFVPHAFKTYHAQERIYTRMIFTE